MASLKNQTATWNRDDRDLIVELRTNMQNVRDEVAQARVEIKEINTGITARILNLESNSVSKIEVSDFDKRIRGLENAANQWFGRQTTIAAFIGAALALLAAYISTGYVHF